MDMHPPPAHVQMAQTELEAPAEPTPIQVNVMRYIPHTAVSVTMLVTVTPSEGAAFIYAPGYEDQGTLFKGPRSIGEVRLAGPIVYVKLYGGATRFDIQYMNYREP